jgi:site-specific DNA recombinase
MKDTCAIYVRVSSDIQDYERQKTELKKYAADNNLEVPNDAVFEDKLSGFKDETQRDGLKHLMDYCRQKKVGKVLVWELSRLARKQLHLLKLADFFEENKINVRFLKQGFWLLDENFKRTAQAGISIAMLGWYSEYEATLMKDRFLSQKRLNESLGKYNGGFIPFGYTLDKNNYYIVKDDIIEGLGVSEADIIREVFNLYESGLVCSKICRICRSKGYPKIVCNTHTLARLLRDTAYIGLKNVKLGQRPTPAIISKAQFDTVRTLIDKNKTKADKGRKHVYLLRGVLKCSVCGGFLYGKQTDDCYICGKNSLSNKTNKNTSCKGLNISVSNIDGIVWSQVKQVLYYIELEGFDKIQSSNQASIDELNEQIVNHKKLIDKNEKQRLKTNQMFRADGITPDEYKRAIREINNEKFQCEKAINELEVKKRRFIQIIQETNLFNERYELINSLTDRTQIQSIISRLVSDVTFYRVSLFKTVIFINFTWGRAPRCIIYNSVQKKHTEYKLLNPYYIQFEKSEKVFYFRQSPIEEELIREDGDWEEYGVYKRQRRRPIFSKSATINLKTLQGLSNLSAFVPILNSKNSQVVDFDFIYNLANTQKHPYMIETITYDKMTYFKELKWERFHRKKMKPRPEQESS